MSLEAKKAREQDAAVRADPFSAFLAARRPAPRREPVWPSEEQQHADPVLLDVGMAARQTLRKTFNNSSLPEFPAGDHFSTFLNFGPARELPKPVTSTDAEQMLREEVLRAKRQLLQVTIQTELHALDPSADKEELTASLRKLRKAQNYLRHPERTEDAMSDTSKLTEDAEAEEPEPEVEDSIAGVACGKSHGAATLVADTTAGMSSIQASTFAPTWTSFDGKQQGSALSTIGAMSVMDRSATSLGASASMPNLHANGSGSSYLPAITGDASRLGTQLLGAPSPQISARSSRLGREPDEPLLSGFYSKSRSWNVGLSNTRARRMTLGLPGGTVVFGNGRMPNFNSSQQLAKGYFYAFSVDAVDDENFPLEQLKGMSLVLGVSRHPPRHKSCANPMYAYEVPGVVLLGYGARLIDKGKWLKTPWDPRDLKVGDIVGVLVTQDEGDLVVFVNEEQVLRVKTSLNDRGVEEPSPRQDAPASPTSLPQPLSSPSSQQQPDSTASAIPPSRGKQAPAPVKRVLFPILDLHGRVSSVTLLPRQNPPNVPLVCRNKVTV